MKTCPKTQYEIERNKPLPSLNHGAIQANLSFELSFFRKKYRAVAELDLDIKGKPFVPDISIFHWQELDFKNDKIKVSEPPLCTIEILCPTQSLTDLTSNANSYFEHGVSSCWIVLPEVHNVYVFSSPDDYDIFRVGETLNDKKMDIQIEVTKVFE